MNENIMKFSETIWPFKLPKANYSFLIILMILSIIPTMQAEQYQSVSSDITASGENQLQLAASFEDGKLFRINGLSVSCLNGSWHEMGRQYGALYRNDLIFIAQIMKTNFVEDGISLQNMLKEGDRIYHSYPASYREIFAGMQETSGLSHSDLLIINAKENFMPDAEGACSAMAVWNNYTSGAPLIFGRNYDYGNLFASNVTVTVWNPEDGSIPFASITYPGSIYVTSALSRERLFLELNNGEISGGMFWVKPRAFGPVSLFSMINDAKNLSDLNTSFQSTNTDVALIVNAAQDNSSISYEWPTWGLKLRDPDQDGLLVSTNHFTDPAWGIPEPEIGSHDVYQTTQRKNNLLNLSAQYKGRITPKTMMQIMSTSIEDGGPFRSQNVTSFATSYQIVAVPSQLKIWVRIPGFVDWTALLLEPYFR